MKKNKLPESVKRIHQRENRSLARRLAAAEASRLDEARTAIHRAGTAEENRSYNINRDAIFSGLHSLVSAVSKSWGIGNPILLTRSDRTQVLARTDFQSVTIQYPDNSKYWKIEGSKVGVGSFNESLLRSLVCDVKGLAYHEIGHLRFTVPFPQLCDMAGTLPSYRIASVQRIWNCLEDQRMEAAVVAESPQIASYFTAMVYNWLLTTHGYSDLSDQYVLVVGRRYLPATTRDKVRRLFVNKYGLEAAKQVAHYVRSYKAATEPADMMANTIGLYELLKQLGVSNGNTSPDDHYGGNTSKGEKPNEKIERSATDEQDDTGSGQDDTDEQGDTAEGSQDGEATDSTGSQANDDADGEDTDGQSDSADDSSDDASDGSPVGTDGETDGGQDSNDEATNSQTSGNGYSPEDIFKEIKETLDEVLSELRQEGSTTSAVRDINQRANSAESSLPVFTNTVGQSPVLSAKAEELVGALVPALSVYTAENSPIWQSRQKTGIIDPFAYRTRPSGSNEYRRQYSDTGNSGIDIAVTIMLDVSMSMRGSEEGLGATAYACKSACDALEIPCTVTTFGSSGSLLWGKDDAPRHAALICDGGTWPMHLFMCLDEQVYDKKLHIVITMTDGIFSLDGGVNRYRSDECDRIFIGLAYGAMANKASLDALGFDFAKEISDLLEIPEVLRSFLATYL